MFCSEVIKNRKIVKHPPINYLFNLFMFYPLYRFKKQKQNVTKTCIFSMSSVIFSCFDMQDLSLI